MTLTVATVTITRELDEDGRDVVNVEWGDLGFLEGLGLLAVAKDTFIQSFAAGDEG